MAVGRAVVATDGSGFAEFIEDGVDGLLVPPGDVAALADALLRLLADPVARERLGTNAAARATRFATPVIAGQFLERFREVAAGA
jgi:glycogen synthase